jgi:hypothetical protein
MTYAPRLNEFVPYLDAKAATVTAPAPAAPRRRGFLHRLLDAVFASAERQAERDVAEYLARSGGRLTDSIEREMTDRIIYGAWRR